MKKMSRTVTGFILGILVAFTIDVAAETLIDSDAVIYSNDSANVTTVNEALNELFSAIEISKQIGDMSKISTIDDGTIAGAINSLNSNIENVENKIDNLGNDLNKYQSKAWQIVTTPTPTPIVSNNTRIYNIDLTSYNEICIYLFANDYGNIDIIQIPIIRNTGHSVFQVDVVDNIGYRWKATVSIAIDLQSIAVSTNDGSTNPTSNYLIIAGLYAR